MPSLILASASPRRRQLLESLGLSLQIFPADVDETLLKGEEPGPYALRVAGNKALTVASMLKEGLSSSESSEKAPGPVSERSSESGSESSSEGSTETRAAFEKRGAQAPDSAPDSEQRFILAADTVVSVDGEVLGKPENFSDFQRSMSLLSGRWHQVSTALALWHGGELSQRLVHTRVRFASLSSEQIAWYWSTEEPADKAGGYGIQGVGGAWVEAIEGSHSNVIGLPLVESLELLSSAGFRMPWRS